MKRQRRPHCHYCTKPLDADTGYCLPPRKCAEIDRGFLPENGVGGSTSLSEKRGIREALAKWGKHTGVML